ncbi:MAG: hypothetical protein IPN01_03445 [Deltaproteobacteria bacterium]|nr:hypothetical protein [Deltaproteobacteria bacterium]
MSTSARAPLAPPPEGWETRFGPLSLVGAHAGVAVWRGRGDGATMFLKRLNEPARAAREAAALRAGLPLRAPRLLGSRRRPTAAPRHAALHTRLTLELAHNRGALDAAIQRYTNPGA